MEEFVYRGVSRNLSKVMPLYIPVLTYGYFRKLLRKGEIKVNGARVKEDIKINDGDIVRVFFDYDALRPVALFESDDVAVFYKPSGLASEGKNSFSELVNRFFPDFILCHRLDTNTDGLIVFAKNVSAAQELDEAFRKRYIEKRYLALCFGTGLKNGLHIAYLKKIPEQSRVVVSDKKENDFTKIQTFINVLKEKNGLSVADIELVTGKTHQIRAHLAFLGHQIIGDPKYGKESVNRLYGKKIQCLTAYKIVFRIPFGKLSYLNGTEVTLSEDKLGEYSL